jgi:two-component system, cell cycle sensor histidine kinase and response regulator CckA
MRDENLARGNLIRRLEKLNQRVVELENTKAQLRQVQELLQKERETFFPILHKAPYGIALIDSDGKFIYINPAFTHITGYTLEDISSGRDWFHIASPFLEYRLEIINSWKKDVIQKCIEKVLSIASKNGEVKEIEFKPTLLDDGRILVILSDITERKRAEEEKATLQEELRQSQKMEAIGGLAGGIAHDFNNLLTVISGNCQLSLLELKEGDPLRGNIEEIKAAAERATSLTRQLLAFSRRQVLNMKVLDLNTIIRDLEKMLRRVIGEDVELVTWFADDLGMVKIDPGWIEQVIMNLAVNARDAMPRGGKLIIETTNAEVDESYTRGHVTVKPGRYVKLCVNDTGMGMAPEVKEHLFEPFFTTKEKGKGTGLGLSTVYGITKQSGGDIWVYSEPGLGTTFNIYLPRVDESLDDLRIKVTKEEIPRGSETILLVEDEEDVRGLAVRILERQGYTVLEASCGKDALALCKERNEPIHMILTDVVMPGMSGRQLADQLVLLHPKTKVLYMSGYTDNAVIHHGILEDRVDYLQKPFTIDGLTRKVREVLDKDLKPIFYDKKEKKKSRMTWIR